MGSRIDLFLAETFPFVKGSLVTFEVAGFKPVLVLTRGGPTIRIVTCLV
ncbi:hypothetical protein [Schlesneria sp. T3-172]